MKYWFDPKSERRVVRADYYTYVKGVKHPDRTIPVHDFFYVLSGALEVSVDGTSWDLTADDSIVLPAGHHHYGTRESTDGTRCIFFHIDAVKSDSAGNESAVDIPAVVHCALTPVIEKLYGAAVSIYQNNNRQCAEELSSIVGTVLYLLHETAKNQRTERDAIAAAAHEAIIRSPDKLVKTEDLAQSLFVSPVTLNKHFEDVYGVSVYQYQRAIRLSRVKDDLLSNRAMTLREIALNNGFADEFHLGRTFKQEFGIAPGGYRKRHTGD